MYPSIMNIFIISLKPKFTYLSDVLMLGYCKSIEENLKPDTVLKSLFRLQRDSEVSLRQQIFVEFSYSMANFDNMTLH